MLPAALTADMHEQVVHSRLVHRRILRAEGERLGYRTRSPASSRQRPGIRGGIGFFRRRGGGGTAKGEKGGITFTNRRPARGQRRGAGLGNRQTSHLSRRLPALLRHPPPRARARHPDRAGAAGLPGRFDDHDLHPCPAPRRPRSSQSPRHAVKSHNPTTPDDETCALGPRKRNLCRF